MEQPRIMRTVVNCPQAQVISTATSTIIQMPLRVAILGDIVCVSRCWSTNARFTLPAVMMSDSYRGGLCANWSQFVIYACMICQFLARGGLVNMVPNSKPVKIVTVSLYVASCSCLPIFNSIFFYD